MRTFGLDKLAAYNKKVRKPRAKKAKVSHAMQFALEAPTTNSSMQAITMLASEEDDNAINDCEVVGAQVTKNGTYIAVIWDCDPPKSEWIPLAQLVDIEPGIKFVRSQFSNCRYGRNGESQNILWTRS
jgi:hypothetical protein